MTEMDHNQKGICTTRTRSRVMPILTTRGGILRNRGLVFLRRRREANVGVLLAAAVAAGSAMIAVLCAAGFLLNPHTDARWKETVNYGT